MLPADQRELAIAAGVSFPDLARLTVIGRQIEVAEQIARPGDPHQYPITVLGWSVQTNKAFADAVKHIRRRPGEEDDFSFRIAEIRMPEQELSYNLRRYIQVNQTILKGLKAIRNGFKPLVLGPAFRTCYDTMYHW
jgi:hypothetical protein